MTTQEKNAEMIEALNAQVQVRAYTRIDPRTGNPVDVRPYERFALDAKGRVVDKEGPGRVFSKEELVGPPDKARDDRRIYRFRRMRWEARDAARRAAPLPPLPLHPALVQKPKLGRLQRMRQMREEASKSKPLPDLASKDPNAQTGDPVSPEKNAIERLVDRRREARFAPVNDDHGFIKGEHILKRAFSDPHVVVLSQKRLGDGINGAEKVKVQSLIDGKQETVVATWKPFGTERHINDAIDSKNFRLGDREVLAAQTANVLGIKHQAVIHATFGGQKGVALQWVDGWTGHDGGFDKLMHKASARATELAVFDYVTANADRHGNNYIGRKVGEKIELDPIDNGYTFPDRPGRGLYNRESRFSERLRKDLPDNDVEAAQQMQAMARRWDDPKVRGSLESVLTKSGLPQPGVKSTLERFDTINSLWKRHTVKNGHDVKGFLKLLPNDLLQRVVPR